MRDMRDHWGTTGSTYVSTDGSLVTQEMTWHGEDGFIEAQVEFRERDGEHTIVLKHSTDVRIDLKPLNFPTRESRRKEEVA